MHKDFVSIMIPCYNGVSFLDRLFRVILNQTYKRIQIIFADDGSCDRTRDVVESYYPEFEKAGMEIKYFYQRNSGQAAAINLALPHVTGEYCMWFDVDDLMTQDHVERKVCFLKEHPECDLVMCKGYVYGEKNINTPIGHLGDEEAVTNFFEDILFERRRCTPGLFMARTSALMAVLLNKHIYDANRRMGQGMQLLLPIALHDHVGYLDDRLFHYVVREDSHSHSIEKDKKKKLAYLEHGQDIKKQVLDELALSDAYRNSLKKRVDLFVYMQKLNILDAETEDKDSQYVKSIIMGYLGYAEVEIHRGQREIVIWGKCVYTEKIESYLKKYADIQVAAYVESDRGKCDGKRVLYRESIRKENMYVIIPLGSHSDIVDLLHERGFEDCKDFFYPEYELRKRFYGKKTLEEQNGISLKDRKLYQYPLIFKYLKNKVNGWSICDFLKEYNYQKVVLYAVTELMDLALDDITYCNQNYNEVSLCDRNAVQYATGYKGYSVMDITTLIEQYESKNVDCIIICSLFHENEIIRNLMKRGIAQDKMISIVGIIFSME